MKASATPQEVEQVVDKIKSLGLAAHLSQGIEATIIGAIGETHSIPTDQFEVMDGVETVQRITQPYKLASRQFHSENSIFSIDGFTVGGDEIAVIAGPCSVESRAQILATAQAVKAGGASMLRGGAFKPRTSPYSFQGHGEAGLELLVEAGHAYELPVVTEVLRPEDVEKVAETADMLQIGARNMQNFSLLREVGRARKPVLLKRGMSATIEELLLAAEYVMAGGNHRVVLCERGIRTFETATRNTLDISAIPVLRAKTHLPVIVDPSHAPGRRDWVESMSLAAAASGADGIIIEVHNEPEKAICDAAQQVPTSEFQELTNKLETITSVIGKTISRA